MTQSVDAWSERLHKSASLATGLRHFGDTHYHEALKLLLRSLAKAPDSDGSVRANADQLIIGLLISRLYSEAGWARSPACLVRTPASPIIITGLPRTGTTLLHKLLATDPQLQGLEAWLAGGPVPRPPRSTWSSLPQYRMTAWAVEGRYRKSPEFRAVHSTAADEVDECFLLLAQDFASPVFTQLAVVPEYEEWLASADMRPSYQRYANNLKLIGFNEPGRRWVLKDPLHLAQLDAVFEVFPRATIVLTHRAPAEAVASTCSLTTRLYSSAVVSDLTAIGPKVCAHWSDALDRCERSRAGNESRFCDVDYRRLVREPLEVVRDIYRHCGLTLSAQAESRMAGWLAQHPQGKHGRHRYSLEEYGLDEPMVERAFGHYLGRFAKLGFDRPAT
jgi:hypothetical protein